jgi:hypothetical protein
MALLMVAFTAGGAYARTLEGRVEAVEQSPQPEFPSDILRAGTTCDTITDGFSGKWYGDVKVTQLMMYPQPHVMHPYCMRFIQEYNQLFGLGESGKVVLWFLKDRSGRINLQTSNVNMENRMKLRFTKGRSSGKALVPGGRDVTNTIADYTRVVDNSVEQTRIDDVSVIDENFGQEIHHGYTEISAHYTLIAPKRMQVKLLEVDYDAQHIPLSKILIVGTATR